MWIPFPQEHQQQAQAQVFGDVAVLIEAESTSFQVEECAAENARLCDGEHVNNDCGQDTFVYENSKQQGSSLLIKRGCRCFLGLIMLGAAAFRYSGYHDRSSTSRHLVVFDWGSLLPIRTRALVRSLETNYVFVHISKCAGTSALRELKKLVPTSKPDHFTGAEYSVKYSQEVYAPANYTLTVVRSPRHHVWSLYSECRYDAGWKNHWLEKIPGGDILSNLSADEGFDYWLSMYVDKIDQDNVTTSTATVQTPRLSLPQENYYRPRADQLESFGCYHPANFQSRHFTSHDRSAHSPSKVHKDVEPDTLQAIQTLRELDWVSLQEFYHESKCLLYYRITTGGKQYSKADTDAGALWKGLTDEQLEEYIETECRCNDKKKEADTSSSSLPTSDIHSTHHAEGKRSSMLDLSDDVLAKVQALTVVDRHLFREHVGDFLRELAWLEEQLGRRVMCDENLKKVEPELRYMGWNVTDLYHHAKRQHQDQKRN